MKNTLYSGWHLILDALTREPERIASVEHLKRMMCDLVEVLRMEILVPPQIVEVPLDETRLATDSDEGGLTGFCVITTSHISIHTWPLRRRFSMDVFSCKPFDPDEALAFLRERLAIEADSVTVLERTWPQGSERADRSVELSALEPGA